MTTAVLTHTRTIPEWTLADRLRKARQVFGGSQRDFAEALEVKTGTYAQWEAGNSMPRNQMSLAKRIEMLTRIPAAWTLGVYDLPPSPTDDGGPAVDSGRATVRLPRLDSNQQPSD